MSPEELEIFEFAYTFRKTVSEIIDLMSFEEFQGWQDYFSRRPVEWRNDHRASMVMAASGARIEVDKVFPSLAALREKQKKENPMNLRSSPMFSRMLNAVGGDSLANILGEENGSK